MVMNNCGKGTTLIIGTLVGGEYRRSRDPELRKLLSPYIFSEVTVENVANRAVFSARLVHCREKDILFLMNFAPEAERPTLKLEKNYSTVRNVETGEILKMAEKQFSAAGPPQEAMVLLLEDR
jgi:hypothetical protein